MKQMMEKDIASKGLSGTVKYERLDTHAVRYEVKVGLSTFDDGYFIGEENSGNTKDAMIERWKKFIGEL